MIKNKIFSNFNFSWKNVCQNFFLIFSVVFFFNAINFSCSAHLEKNETQGSQKILLEFIHDKNEEFTIEKISKNKNLNWQKPEKHKISFGYTNAPYWFKFNFENKNPEKHFYFEFSNPLLGDIEFYIPKKNNKFKKIKTGTFYPFDSRPIKNKNFIFSSKNSGAFYFRIKTLSPFSFDLKVFDEHFFYKEKNSSDKFLWIFFGAMFVIFFHNIFIFLAIRDKNYFYSAFLVLFLTLFMFWDKGLGFQFFWPNCPWFQNHCVYFFLSCVFISTVFYFKEFLDLKKFLPKIYKIFVINVWVCVPMVIASIFFLKTHIHIIEFFYSLWILILIINILVILIFAIKKKLREAIFVTIGFLAILFSAIFVTLECFFPIFHIPNIMQISSLFMILTFSAGLADKINLTKNKFLKANAKLKNLDQMKNNFLAMVSHKLRTPLASMRWFLEMFLNEDFGKINKDQKENLEELSKSNSQMISLVNNFLDVSKLEAGKLTPEISQFDFAELVKKNTEEIESIGDDKKITLKISPKILQISSDKTLVCQVIQNLISNAIKYSPKNSEIKIFVSKKNNLINFEIQNLGEGISEKDKIKIFDKFYRSASVVYTQSEGTGIGLYLTKLIVEKLGGKINFTSEKNKITKFYFHLPIKFV